MKRTLIKEARIINEGKIVEGDVLIVGERIEKVGTNLSDKTAEVIDARGLFLMPGAIDDQVHFREPGLTHKGDLYTEPVAAVAGGITSFMEMPNTVPNALTQELLSDKYLIASQKSVANYSFYMGVSNDNLEEVLKTDGSSVCGIKIFLGASTGNMLVDNPQTLENVFSQTPLLITTHCEYEPRVRERLLEAKARYGEDIPVEMHPVIRDTEACYLSSSFAIGLAKKYGTRLHILHISTAKETELFSNAQNSKDKKITAEACIHHLWFDDRDYKSKGNLIKWNPAIKTSADREAILAAVLDGRIDVIATDHAPHTLEEKNSIYTKAPSGGPLVQHAVPSMFEMVRQGKISAEKVIEKMCHTVADLFMIKDRGYIREGYKADLALLNPDSKWTVDKSNILAKCGWSPFEGTQFHTKVMTTFVNGNKVYDNGIINDTVKGQRLYFDR